MKEKSPFVAEVIWDVSAEYQGDAKPEIIEETIEVGEVDEVDADADIAFDKNATELEVESVVAPKE